MSQYTALAKLAIEERKAKNMATRTLAAAKVKFGGAAEALAFHNDLLFIAGELDPTKGQTDRDISEFYAALKFGPKNASLHVIKPTLLSSALFAFLDDVGVLGLPQSRSFSTVMTSMVSTHAINGLVLEIEALKRKLSYADLLDMTFNYLHPCGACKCTVYRQPSATSPTCKCGHDFEFHKHAAESREDPIYGDIQTKRFGKSIKSFDNSARKLNDWFGEHRYMIKTVHSNSDDSVYEESSVGSVRTRKLKRLLEPRMEHLNRDTRQACPICTRKFGDLPGCASVLHIRAVREDLAKRSEPVYRGGRVRRNKEKGTNLAVQAPSLPVTGPWQKWMRREAVCIFCSQFFKNTEYQPASTPTRTLTGGPKPKTWLGFAGMKSAGKPNKARGGLKTRKYKPYIPTIVRPPETDIARSPCDDADQTEDADDDDNYYSDGSLGSDEEPLTLEERLADAEKERIYLLKQIEHVKKEKQKLSDLLKQKEPELKQREEDDFQFFLERQKTFWGGDKDVSVDPPAQEEDIKKRKMERDRKEREAFFKAKHPSLKAHPVKESMNIEEQKLWGRLWNEQDEKDKVNDWKSKFETDATYSPMVP